MEPPRGDEDFFRGVHVIGELLTRTKSETVAFEAVSRLCKQNAVSFIASRVDEFFGLQAE